MDLRNYFKKDQRYRGIDRGAVSFNRQLGDTRRRKARRCSRSLAARSGESDGGRPRGSGQRRAERGLFQTGGRRGKVVPKKPNCHAVSRLPSFRIRTCELPPQLEKGEPPKGSR